MNCTCGHLKARRRTRIQGKEEPKTDMYKQMMYPPVKGPLRALQAQPNTLQHPLLWLNTPSYTPSNILSYNHSTHG